MRFGGEANENGRAYHETVDKLVRKYHTRDPYELCQLLGIKIHYYDLQKKLKGFFYYQSRQKNIVIDHNVNGILERILVAHELGHAVLHTKIAMMHGFQEMEVFDDRSIEENEANFFAAELLNGSSCYKRHRRKYRCRFHKDDEGSKGKEVRSLSDR